MATKIADLYKDYALESDIYSVFVVVEQISLKLALDSIVELYYKTLKHTHTDYTSTTLRQLLDHLVTTYAAIYQFDLEKNQEKMTARYDPNAPLRRCSSK